MGITDSLSIQLEDIFNHWSKVRIEDSQVKKLISLALAPSKEIIQNLKNDDVSELSACFTNCVEACYEYAMSNDAQLNKTCEGTIFGAYNAVTGYFQNLRNYKDSEAKLKSLLLGGTAQQRGQSAFNLCTDFAQKGNSMLYN